MNILLEDFRSHREGLLAQGFWALGVYRFGATRRNFSSPLIRKPWGLMHKILVKICEIFLGISINMHARLGRRVIFEHLGYIIIHANAIIGDDVIIRQGVTIGNRYLDKPLDAPCIGSRVNIGAGACILGQSK
jgi:serine O-acetyltransferase